MEEGGVTWLDVCTLKAVEILEGRKRAGEKEGDERKSKWRWYVRGWLRGEWRARGRPRVRASWNSWRLKLDNGCERDGQGEEGRGRTVEVIGRS